MPRGEIGFSGGLSHAVRLPRRIGGGGPKGAFDIGRTLNHNRGGMEMRFAERLRAVDDHDGRHTDNQHADNQHADEQRPDHHVPCDDRPHRYAEQHQDDHDTHTGASCGQSDHRRQQDDQPRHPVNRTIAEQYCVANESG